MLVVSDVEDVFLPKPTDLLVNLSEARASLEALLGRLGDMFQDNHIIGSALGPALQAGFQLMVRDKASIFTQSELKLFDSHQLAVRSLSFRLACPLSVLVP